MKIAALYDIHGNYPALNAVYKQIQNMNPDLIIIGGDVLAGPMPLETMALIMEMKKSCKVIGLRGNNDQDIINFHEGKATHLTDAANKQIAWVTHQLNLKQFDFLKHLKQSFTVGHYFFCHATAYDNHLIFTTRQPEDVIAKYFNGISAKTIICGHTHIQFYFRLQTNKIINAGSIGMPFSNTNGAQWLWIENNKFEFKTTPFDKTLAKTVIRSAKAPFAESFIKTHVENTISKKKGLKILTNLLDKQNNS